MILVDTSVWVVHLREGDQVLADLLEDSLVLSHPWVIAELALGHLSQRREILGLLANLPSAEVATADEILRFIRAEQLYELGIGFVDCQLLAATRLTEGARLWTGDWRLADAAGRLGLLADQALLGLEP